MTERNPVPRRTALDGAAFAVAFVGILVVSRMDAGLSGAWVLIGLVTALPMYVAARGWRLSWWLHTAAAALPVGVVVAALAHDSWTGAARAARYGWGALLVLGLVAWARTPARRLVAAGGLLILVADQYLTGWWIWWGQGDPSVFMRGNYYWHNQFGIAMAIGIAVAAVLVAAGSRVLVLVAAIVGCLAAAGVVGSASRASIALAVAAVAVAALIAVVSRGWRGLARIAVLAAAMAGTVWFMASSVFFPGVDGSAAGEGLSRRGSAGNSWHERVIFWLEGIRMGAEAPLAGVGLQAYGPTMQCMGAEAYSSNPHSEFVLAWAETGLVGGLAMLAVLVGTIALVVRSLAPSAERTSRGLRWLPSGAELLADPARWGALVAVVIAVGHAAFDFDWSYPALVALAGIAGGIAAAPVIRMRDAAPAGRILGLALVAVHLAAAAAGFFLDPLPGETLTPLPLDAVPCESA